MNFISPLIDPSKFSFPIELLGYIPYDTKLFGILFEKLDWKNFKLKPTPIVPFDNYLIIKRILVSTLNVFTAADKSEKLSASH
jgi:hypothetical protein